MNHAHVLLRSNISFVHFLSFFSLRKVHISLHLTSFVVFTHFKRPETKLNSFCVAYTASAFMLAYPRLLTLTMVAGFFLLSIL